MKKHLFQIPTIVGIAVFLLIAGMATVQAQGRRAGQSSVQASYGYMPSMVDAKGDAFMLKGGYGLVFGDNGWLGRADFVYFKHPVKYTNNRLFPYEKYGINVQAGWSYEELHPVSFNGFAGIFGAYEKINNGNTEDLVYNNKIPYKMKQFTFGFSGTAEIEVMLIEQLSLTVDYTQFYDIISKFSKGRYAIFGGLKFYIN